MIDRAPNATRLMDKLCAKKLIERLSCKTDRRIVHIEITKKGKQLLKEISNDFNDDLIKNLSENDAKHLSNLLDKMR